MKLHMCPQREQSVVALMHGDGNPELGLVLTTLHHCSTLRVASGRQTPTREDTAQLMGLHRADSASMFRALVWWFFTGSCWVWALIHLSDYPREALVLA